MSKYNKILFLLLFFVPVMAFAQVNIKITIDNQQDSVYYLSGYRGSKTSVADSAIIKKGMIQFKNKEKFPEGIYLLTTRDGFPLIEILIGKDQKFSLEINDLEDWSTIKVKGAKETANYYQLMAKMRQKDSFLDESLKIKRKDAFINLVINSLKTHSMENYWDDFQLDDARILTYPLIDKRLDAYFDNLYVNSETINAEIDKLIAKTGDCIKVRDYLLWYFYQKYYCPKYMNLDDVYIHIVDDYFLKLEMDNVSESALNLMADRAMCLEHLKLGAQLPNIGKLYDIESQYITVFFYDKTCQKCAQEGRILEEIQQRHPEMAIFPVEVNSTDIKNLLFLFDIQTTPMIYVLDKRKHIIAKRIKAGQVEQVLNMD